MGSVVATRSDFSCWSSGWSYAIADREVVPEPGEPQVIWCLDEFGPLSLMPHPGRQWTGRGGRRKDPDREPRPRRPATYHRYDGVRHLFAAHNLIDDKLFGHVKPRKRRGQSRPSSPRCATSPSTAPTTPPTGRRPA